MNNIGFNFKNTYEKLPEDFYTKIEIEKSKKPELLILNKELLKELDLNIENLNEEKLSEIFTGTKLLEGMEPLAQAYGGHQFGSFNMLGDGRAVLLGEHIKKDGERVDIQLKGSGRTPYSRVGDGKAAIKPMLREYIISEGMNGLGIETTRSLAVCLTGENVFREDLIKGAILTRVAKSHIRVGTFQYANVFLDKEKLKDLADYTLERHFKGEDFGDNKYLYLLKRVIENNAKLIAKWMIVGFIHGVMNTDNMTITGETIDYGPCAFMDEYNSDTVFSSIDYYGRYAYGNQPNVGGWNLGRFAESLIPLLHEDREEAIRLAQEEINEYGKIYEKYWLEAMTKKLGLFDVVNGDKLLVESLLNIMEKNNLDYTNLFYTLTTGEIEFEEIFKKVEFKNWYSLWNNRLGSQGKDMLLVRALMQENNPVIIPRNFRVEKALDEAEAGNLEELNNLVEALKNPYDYKKDLKKYRKLEESKNTKYRTYCGT